MILIRNLLHVKCFDVEEEEEEEEEKKLNYSILSGLNRPSMKK
jgi:ssRNA-specific RNase YbeY (16S rRNA maturation enzyme)